MKSALGAADFKLSADDASPWSLSTFAIDEPFAERDISITFFPESPNLAASFVPTVPLPRTTCVSIFIK